jgi:hypothetical protein
MREQKPKDEKIGVNSFKFDAGPTTGKKRSIGHQQKMAHQELNLQVHKPERI